MAPARLAFPVAGEGQVRGLKDAFACITWDQCSPPMPAAIRSAEDSVRVKAEVAVTRDQGFARVQDMLAARWFPDDFCAARPEVIEWHKAQVIETPADVFLNVFDGHAGARIGFWLCKIAAPILVISGEDDGDRNRA